MRMDTKRGRVVPYREGFLPIKPHDPLIRDLERSRDKLNLL